MRNFQITCPCQSGQQYLACCGRYIEGKTAAPTPEALMRSRYSAYTLANIDYFARTQISPAADNFDKTAALSWAEQSQWLGLSVVRAWIDAKSPTRGFIEFIARFRSGNKNQEIHEISEFVKRRGEWFYKTGL